MRIAITENHPDGPLKMDLVVLYFPDDADIEVDIVEDEEDHWANRWVAKPLTVRSLKRRITLKNGDIV